MSAKAPAAPTTRSGFCNRLNGAASHERCRWGDECVCDCHKRFGVIWLDWMGEPQTQGEFRTEADAALVLAMLKRLELIPADSETDVVPYRVGEDWL